MPQKPYRRGYPVAILIGVECDHASIWQIFSQVAKHQQTIPLNGSRMSAKSVYNFHELILNALRPVLQEGVKSIVVASPPRTSFAQGFLSHVRSHHAWLFQGQNKAAISTITGSASTPADVAVLTKTEAFKQLVNETTAKETENLLGILEKKLNSEAELVFYSLEEAENLILPMLPPSKVQLDYLLLTDEYLSESRRKNRVQRLLQIAKNKGVKTRVISSETAAGERINQLGGLICLAEHA